MKATKAEKERRELIVMQWIISGKPKPIMVQEAAKLWSIGERQVENYIKKSQLKLVEENQEEVQLIRAIGKQRLEALFYKSIEKNDLKTALQVIQKQMEYFGILRDSEENKEITFINNIPE